MVTLVAQDKNVLSGSKQIFCLAAEMFLDPCLMQPMYFCCSSPCELLSSPPHVSTIARDNCDRRLKHPIHDLDSSKQEPPVELAAIFSRHSSNLVERLVQFGRRESNAASSLTCSPVMSSGNGVASTAFGL